jgi:hypothetical protein
VVVVVAEPTPVVVVVGTFEDGVVVLVVAFGEVPLAGLVVVVVALGGVVGVVTLGEGTKRFFSVGAPARSSMAVTKAKARTKTIAAAPAMADRLNRPVAPVRWGAPPVPRGNVVAWRRSMAGASAVALTSRPAASPTGAAGAFVSVIRMVSSPLTRDPPADETSLLRSETGSTSASEEPLALVVPSRRRSVDDSGARTTACFTASRPRSIDCATSAVAIVATADPMATPMIVPVTPKVDAMSAAVTAPATDARI